MLHCPIPPGENEGEAPSGVEVFLISSRNCDDARVSKSVSAWRSPAEEGPGGAAGK